MAGSGTEEEITDGESAAVPSPPPGRIRRIGNVALVLLALALAFLPPEFGRQAVGGKTPVAGREDPEPKAGTRPTRDPPKLPDQQAPRGWVIDGAGAPVAEVSIRARVDGAAAPGDSTPIAVTGTDGAFVASGLSDGTHVLSLSGGSIFPAEVRWQLPGPPVRVMVTRRHTIEGIVTDDGKPAAGVRVALSDGSGPATLSATTDEQGGFRFDDLVPGLYELWAQAVQRASPVIGIARFGPGPHPPVEIPLQPATVVRGRVVDHEKKSGLSASLVLASTTGATRDRVTRSNADGFFAFDGVLDGRFAIEADAPGYVALADYTVKVDARQAQTEIELRLRRGGVAIGRVVDVRGDPVVGADLIMRRRDKKGGQSYSAAARAQRTRRFVDDPSTSTEQALARWVHPLAGKRRLPVRTGRRFGASREGNRPAECGRGHCGVDLGFERGAVVHAASDGKLINVRRESRGLAGRFVSIEHAAGIKTAYMHLDDIRADLVSGQKIRAGEPIGTVGRTGIRISGPHLHFAMSQRRAARFWFIDPEPMLRHAVVLPEPASLDAFAGLDADEEGVRTLVATVAPKPSPGPLLLPRPSEEGAATARFATDDKGRFTIDGLRPGSYEAWAFHPDLAAGSSKPFRIRVGQETRGILIKLSPGVVLFGRVTSAGGPVGGARVIAEIGKAEYVREVAEAVTDDTGSYALPSLSGALTLRVSALGFGRAERAVTLSNRGAEVLRREQSFVLAPANAELIGRVDDPDGFPLRGARISITRGPSGGGRATDTDDNGSFTFAALSDGAYELRIASPSYPPAKAKAKTGERAILSVQQGGGARLLVRDAHTQASLPGVRVRASGPARSRREVTTDSGGVAALLPLLPGTWQVEVRLPGYVLAQKTIDVPAGRGPAAISVDRVLLELARGATLGGVVSDVNGDRVAGAKVTSGSVTATTDQHGRFTLIDVPTGTVAVSATRGNESGSIELALAPGDELRTLEILFRAKPAPGN